MKEVYRLRAQCKSRRVKHLTALKVLDQCASALEHVIARHRAHGPVGVFIEVPCEIVIDALEQARALVLKK